MKERDCKCVTLRQTEKAMFDDEENKKGNSKETKREPSFLRTRFSSGINLTVAGTMPISGPLANVRFVNASDSHFAIV